MNKRFNEWYIDVSISPEDGQLGKRIAVIDSFAKSVTANDIVNLVKLYYDFDVDNDYKNAFSEKFSEDDPAFSSRYTEELKLLAGATLVEVAEHNSAYDSLSELLTISHRFFHAPSSSDDILTCIKKQFDEDRRNLREATVTPGKIASFDISDLDEQLKTDAWDENTSEVVLDKFKNIHTAIKTLSENFTNMNEQCVIYQEDSQILWWMTACWSNDLNCSYKNMDKLSASIIIGKEASALVSNFPCPYAMQGVLSHIIECSKGKNDAVTISDLIMKGNRNWMKDQLSTIESQKILNLLPLASAIVRSDNTTKTEEWFPKYEKEILSNATVSPKTPIEYAWQMFLEMTTIKCYTSLVSKEKKNG